MHANKKEMVVKLYQESLTSGEFDMIMDKFNMIWLVVEPTPLKNMLVKLDHFPKDRQKFPHYPFQLPVV